MPASRASKARRFAGVSALVAFTAFPLAAQQSADSATVRFRVTREGTPVPGATVMVFGRLTSSRLVTARDGAVTIRLPAPRQFRLVITAIGYRPDTLRLSLPPGLQDTTLIVGLRARRGGGRGAGGNLGPGHHGDQRGSNEAWVVRRTGVAAAPSGSR